MGESVVRGSDWRYRARQVFSLTLLLGGMLATAGRYAALTASGGKSYKSGDWLINYAGGFVRRGLFGDLLLGLHLPTTFTLWLLFTLQTLCYLIITWYFVSFLGRERYSWWSIAVACNPAALMFAVYDFGGAYRKEILVFVSLILLAMAQRTQHSARWRAYALTMASLLIYGLAIYSWEPAAFALPMVIYLLWRIWAEGCFTLLHTVSVIVLAAVIAVSGLVLSITAHGNEGQVIAIANSLQSRGFDLSRADAGAIEAIGWTSRSSLSMVAASYPLYLLYLPMLALGMLPAISGEWLRRNRCWAIAFAVCMLPLYVTGIDYGRWTHVLVMGITICAMTAGPDTLARRWRAPIAVVFIVSWGVPYLMASDWIYRGLAQTVYEVVSRFVS